MKHILMVNNDEKFGLQNGAAYVFDSEDSAIEFAVAKLIEAGELHHEGRQYLSRDRQTVYDKADDALEDWQYQLEEIELFHVYPLLEPPK